MNYLSECILFDMNFKRRTGNLCLVYFDEALFGYGIDLSIQGTEIEPEFEGTITNVTFPAGREAVLTCSVKNLDKYKVGWLRASDQTVLALANRVVSHNPRISVVHEDMRTWRLRIRQLRESDRGCYMCQINTSPMKKQIGCIDVQVPPNIVDEESSADIAVQEGEDAILTCRATGHPPPRVTWKREDGDFMLLRKPGSRELIKELLLFIVGEVVSC
uniref:CSON006129 protein n=1 Tax=Culicoides sonorensis TaxID=179676 RepID=A0A336MSZ1_CULSO